MCRNHSLLVFATLGHLEVLEEIEWHWKCLRCQKIVIRDTVSSIVRTPHYGSQLHGSILEQEYSKVGLQRHRKPSASIFTNELIYIKNTSVTWITLTYSKKSMTHISTRVSLVMMITAGDSEGARNVLSNQKNAHCAIAGWCCRWAERPHCPICSHWAREDGGPLESLMRTQGSTLLPGAGVDKTKVEDLKYRDVILSIELGLNPCHE
jgi:hypothetical protein